MSCPSTPRYDKVKKSGGNMDEVLEAEVAGLRQQLRCAACNQRQKVRPIRNNRIGIANGIERERERV